VGNTSEEGTWDLAEQCLAISAEAGITRISKIDSSLRCLGTSGKLDQAYSFIV
jgi:hypothetical protein